MKDFFEYKEEILKCSQCGLCMSVCPLYEQEKNDCASARGFFLILKGIIKGDLELDDVVLKYLNRCENCDKCKVFCPSGIDIPKIVESAKRLIS